MVLQRFVSAQAGTYVQALRELRAGRKTSHWMWWILPQVAGLGQSPTSQSCALASTGEAGAYLAHDVLGPRLHVLSGYYEGEQDEHTVRLLG